MFSLMAFVGGPGGPTFDPATLALSGWWRASYAGVPWTPTASAGTSGANGNLAANVNAPTVGAAVGGFTPAVCNGSSSPTAKGLLSVNTGGTFVTAGAGTLIVLARVNSFRAAGGDWTLDDPLWRTSTRGIGVSSNGVRAGSNSYGLIEETAFLPVSSGAWVAAAHTWSGVTQALRVGDASAAAAFNGAAASLTALQAGKAASSSVATDCEILELMAAPTALADADVTRIFDEYFAPRYGVTLA